MMTTIECTTLPRETDTRIASALDKARHARAATLLTASEPAPPGTDAIAFLSAASSRLGDGIFWSQPAAVVEYAGAGTALEITAGGGGRFARVAEQLADLTIVGAPTDRRFPIFGGFAFDQDQAPSANWHKFPGARFVIPLVLLERQDSRIWVRYCLPVRPDDSFSIVADRLEQLREDVSGWLHAPGPNFGTPQVLTRNSLPNRAAWEVSVADAVAAIRAGEFAKVVLAREECLTFDQALDPGATLRRLRDASPNATTFAMQSGQSWFLGATPERLVRLDGRQVDVTCLAGSIATSSDPIERERLAHCLLASTKDREEHEIVVRSTMAALEEVCDEVTRQEGTPRVVTAGSVQHLESPLTARASASTTVLDLVERLHPTPAVGGFPASRALPAMRRLEKIDRGWYAGPFGWVDLGGSGEFVVGIRSALIDGETASLFAGCGIVADSDPGTEFVETELKLRPMLAALGDS